MKDVENRLFASELRCAIYSVDHRLAPESPHPAPVEDIYSIFAWLHANAGQLGLDPARIGIKGESGGGGFAAAAALYARDRQEIGRASCRERVEGGAGGGGCEK